MRSFITILALFVALSSHAQVKVAQYSIGKYRTTAFEEFKFWTKDGKQSKILYSYGTGGKEIPLRYVGTGKVDGNPCFKVQFPNGYILYVIPSDLRLRIVDPAEKYNKVFSWEYEGPVDGIGTYCSVCADSDREAMEILTSAYLSIKM